MRVTEREREREVKTGLGGWLHINTVETVTQPQEHTGSAQSNSADLSNRPKPLFTIEW